MFRLEHEQCYLLTNHLNQNSLRCLLNQTATTTSTVRAAVAMHFNSTIPASSQFQYHAAATAALIPYPYPLTASWDYGQRDNGETLACWWGDATAVEDAKTVGLLQTQYRCDDARCTILTWNTVPISIIKLSSSVGIIYRRQKVATYFWFFP